MCNVKYYCCRSYSWCWNGNIVSICKCTTTLVRIIQPTSELFSFIKIYIKHYWCTHSKYQIKIWLCGFSYSEDIADKTRDSNSLGTFMYRNDQPTLHGTEIRFENIFKTIPTGNMQSSRRRKPRSNWDKADSYTHIFAVFLFVLLATNRRVIV